MGYFPRHEGTVRRIPAGITRREYRVQLRLQRKARVKALKRKRLEAVCVTS